MSKSTEKSTKWSNSDMSPAQRIFFLRDENQPYSGGLSFAELSSRMLIVYTLSHLGETKSVIIQIILDSCMFFSVFKFFEKPCDSMD